MRDAGGGAIVNITSISAVRASTLRSAYGTSKAGLAHLTKQLAVELASLGIRVNAVAPGPVDTAMAKEVHTQEIRADYHDAIPLNRYGLEEELAEAIFFLCSGGASYITGQIPGPLMAASMRPAIGLPDAARRTPERLAAQSCRVGKAKRRAHHLSKFAGNMVGTALTPCPPYGIELVETPCDALASVQL